jgi:hypothetical protein
MSIIVIGIIASVTRSLFHVDDEAPVIADGARTRALQLDVVNAAETPRLAQTVTDFLRQRGFDVVEIRTQPGAPAPVTKVIARMRNPEAARKVATALGVKDENIIDKYDPTLYLDISVVIGKDYPSLAPFKQ